MLIQVVCLANVASAYLNAGVEPKRWGTAHSNVVPYQSFATANGRHIVTGAGNDRQFQVLCDVTGLQHLKDDGRFLTNSLRVQHRTELISELSTRSATVFKNSLKTFRY